MLAALSVTLLSAIANLVVGLFAYIKSPKNAAHQLFLVLALSIAGWLVVNQLAFVGFPKEITLFLTRFVMTLAVMQAASFFLFSVTFPHDRIPLSRRFLICYLSAVVGVMALTLSPFLFADVVIESSNVVPQPAPGIVIFLVLAVGSLLAGMYSLVKKYLTSKGLQRLQIGYMLLGVVSMFGALLLFNVVFVLVLKTSTLTVLGSASTLFFTGAIAYAIVKHRLFDLRLIIARALTYSALVAILLVIYTGLVFGVSTLLFRGEVHFERVVIYALASLFVAVTFQPLKQLLERLTDKILFQGRYDTNQLLYDLTKVLATTQGINAITAKTLEILVSRMHIARGVFFIVTPRGLTQPANHDMVMPEEATLDLLKILSKEQTLLIYEDVTDEFTRQFMQDRNVSLIAALSIGSKLQGALLMGEKLSGQMYTDQDIQALDILIPELAVAIENALYFEQISQFNQVLEHEVDQATQNLRVANEQLSQKNHQLEQLDKLKDEFISVTSHELRTPLTAIRGYLWMIQHGKQRDEKFNEYLDRAYVSTERLLAIVNDTLDISRIESGRVKLSPEPTDLVQLCEEVVAELGSKADAQSQQLRLARPVAGLPSANCDPNKIHQVLTNLVGNALKFTPNNGKINITVKKDDQHIIVSVSDTGPGISQADQDKLFKKFSRLESTASVQGTGLGLYLCKQIVELSGGKIWIESQPGAGATFSFSLPLSDQQASIRPILGRQFKKTSHQPPPV